MKEIFPFEFERTRGVVWVCDIEKSSAFLNDSALVDDIEAFLPRFYYVSKLMVETYGGTYLKWTGDGFLAFFKIELERDLLKISQRIFEAALQLTVMSTITQMGLTPTKKIWIRHGITYEKDALLMKIQSEDGNKTLDIIGRSVVLAFRLLSIKTIFPFIATVKELISKKDLRFIIWKPTKEEKLIFFKGETLGIKEIRISGQKEKAITNWDAESKRWAKRIVNRLKEIRSGKNRSIIQDVVTKMEEGPDWCKEIIEFEKKEFEKITTPLNELIFGFRELKNNKKESAKGSEK